jgi:hypothetical protein
MERRLCFPLESGRQETGRTCPLTVVAEDGADLRLVRCYNRVVTRKASRQLRDDAEANGVMIAACDQRRARRRTQGGRVEFCKRNPALAIRSSAGVGMTPPNVPLTP